MGQNGPEWVSKVGGMAFRGQNGFQMGWGWPQGIRVGSSRLVPEWEWVWDLAWVDMGHQRPEQVRTPQTEPFRPIPQKTRPL
jgi:hypothetical protein